MGKRKIKPITITLNKFETGLLINVFTDFTKIIKKSDKYSLSKKEAVQALGCIIVNQVRKQINVDIF